MRRSILCAVVVLGGIGQSEALAAIEYAVTRIYTNPIPGGGVSPGTSVAALGDEVLIDALDGEHACLFDGDTGDRLQTFFNPLPGETFGHGIAGVGESVFVGAPRYTDACAVWSGRSPRAGGFNGYRHRITAGGSGSTSINQPRTDVPFSLGVGRWPVCFFEIEGS